jgi:Domain of unknown function (DUF4337)
VSENITQVLHNAGERRENIERGNRAAALAAAIIAVLAALGALFAHHRSISALTAKSQAILLQARAAERRNSAEGKEIRSELYAAMLKAGIAQTPESRRALSSVVDREKDAAASANREADTFENESLDYDARSDVTMKSYEILQWATAIFDMSIVLVSISTLSRNMALLVAGGCLGGFGLILMIAGLLQGH